MSLVCGLPDAGESLNTVADRPLPVACAALPASDGTLD